MYIDGKRRLAAAAFIALLALSVFWPAPAIEISAAVPTVHSVRNQLTIGGEPRAAVALSRPSARADEPNPVAASEVRA